MAGHLFEMLGKEGVLIEKKALNVGHIQSCMFSCHENFSIMKTSLQAGKMLTMYSLSSWSTSIAYSILFYVL